MHLPISNPVTFPLASLYQLALAAKYFGQMDVAEVSMYFFRP